MGLFDFLKNKKKSVPTPPKPDVSANADEMMRQQKLMILDNTIATLGINVENLNLDFYDNVATVGGLIQSEEERNAIVTALNAVDGVYSVNDNLEVAAPPAPEFETYVIQKGDSLSKIAKRYFGDPMKYKEIFEANKDILDDPNKIFPGQEIKIPLK